MIDIDRRDFIAGLGGAAVVSAMSHEARADELEDELNRRLQLAQAPATESNRFPTATEVEAQITTRSYRRGAGRGFLNTDGENVARLH
jgi:hypothetical protein